MTSQNGHASVFNERIDSIAGELKSAAERLSTAAAQVKDRASEVTAQARAGADSLASRATKAIQDHPIAAIGIAFGAGYLLMRMIRR